MFESYLEAKPLLTIDGNHRRMVVNNNGCTQAPRGILIVAGLRPAFLLSNSGQHLVIVILWFHGC